MRTIAVTNQKGGVGKTTTVANLGSALAKRGKKVALLDLDPQANLTMSLGVDPSSVTHSIYSVLTGGELLSQAAMVVEENLTLFPAVIDLAAAEVELAGEVGREHILLGRFNAEPLLYDLLLIDCPPSLGLLTLNALAAVDEVLIPLQPHFLALQGLGRLLETVELVHERINPRLSVGGVIFCMYESATKLANEVVDDVCKFFDAARGQGKPWSAGRVFQTRIRRNIKLAEAPSFGASILNYEPTSNGAKDYTALAEEFLGECPAGEAPSQPAPAPSETPQAMPAQVQAPPVPSDAPAQNEEPVAE